MKQGAKERRRSGRVRRFPGTALVLGLGASGEAAARLLADGGARVTVVDRADGAAQRGRARKLEKAGVRVLTGVETLPAERFDMGILSPGIPADSPWVVKLEHSGTEVISELELGARHCRWPILAVTGSSGKSTLVKLCGESLTASGMKVALGGNYGEPLSRIARRNERLDWVVVEVSSFQLEKVRDFRPRVGILLNLLPNHLDRHGSMRAYAEAKARLFGGMRRGDTAIVNEKSLRTVRRLAGGGNRWISFGLRTGAEYRYKNESVVFRRGTKTAQISFSGTRFGNPVMGLTAAAAVAAVRACGGDVEAVGSVAAVFEPLQHRMSEVAVVDGVRFVNDSKATTLGALKAALEMTDGGVRLIAGGLFKERSVESVKEMLAKKVKTAYLIGSVAKEMAAGWKDVVMCRLSGNLERAVRSAWRDAVAGDTILLSPACASFDQFRSFEDRGDQFIACAREIKKGSRRK